MSLFYFEQYIHNLKITELISRILVIKILIIAFYQPISSEGALFFQSSTKRDKKNSLGGLFRKKRTGILLPKLFWPTVKFFFCKFSAFSLEFQKFFSITRTIYQTVKGQNNFWSQNAFLTCSWRFLISNKLEQLDFKLEKIIGI